MALARGGAFETVEDGETGVLFAEPTVGIVGGGTRARVHDRRFDR